MYIFGLPLQDEESSTYTVDASGNRTQVVENLQPPIALTTTIISHWKLDEASGARADSADSNSLTDNNSVNQAAGKLGNSAHFTATASTYLSHVDNAGLSTGDIDFTLAAWVYLDSKGADRTLVSKWNPDSNQREYALRYSTSADRFVFSVSSNGTTQTTLTSTAAAPATGTWYFVLGWHDSVNNTLNIQVNNGPVDSTTYSSGVFDSSAAFRLGALDSVATPSYLDGRLDSVSFWKRILTADERTTLYNGGAGCDYAFTTCSVTITYTYDNLYRLTNAKYSIGSVFTYTYDAVGNRLTETTTSYGYDAANRLITTTQGATNYSFASNGDGVRLKQTVNTTPTTYTVDLAAGLTQVLVDISSGVTNTYLYGNRHITQHKSDAGASYFLDNALSSDAKWRIPLAQLANQKTESLLASPKVYLSSPP